MSELTCACGALFSVRVQEASGLVDGEVSAGYGEVEGWGGEVYEAEGLGWDGLREDEEGFWG